jgi:hypothetical protein
MLSFYTPINLNNIKLILLRGVLKMFCKKCKTKFEGGNFCPNCGIQQITQYQTVKPKLGPLYYFLKGSMYFMIMGIILLIGLISLFLFGAFSG